MEGIHVDHCGLSLTDLEAGERFYGRAFGFMREFAFTLAPHPVRGLMLRNASGARLELFAREGSRAGIQGQAPIDALATRGYGHVALAASDIAPVFAAALAAGARPIVEPSPSPEPGVRFAFLSDPEGNLVELVERT